MNSKVWCVVQENLVWQYCHDLDCNLWGTASRKQITPSRINEESANKDYANLGFKLRNDSTVQCYDAIVPGKSWVRHIVQCRTIL